MATVTTALLPAVQAERFVSAGARAGNTEGLPIGRLDVSYNFSTTGTGVGDVEELSIQLDLPLNYFYRLLSLGITFYSGSQTDVGRWSQNNWLVEFRSTESTYYTQLRPYIYYNAASYVTAGPYSATASQNSMELVPGNPALLGQVIDGRGLGTIKSPARVVIKGYNPTASTGSVGANLRMTGLQYTVEDSLNYPLWYTGNLINQ